MFTNFIHTFIEDEFGQGITEYGAVIAFIAVLIAATLMAGQNALGTAVKNTFSVTIHSLSQIGTSAS